MKSHFIKIDQKQNTVVNDRFKFKKHIVAESLLSLKITDTQLMNSNSNRVLSRL